MGIAAVIALVIAVVQIILLSRYMSRLPDDTLGIWMHVLLIIIWIVVAVMFFRKSKSQHPGEQ